MVLDERLHSFNCPSGLIANRNQGLPSAGVMVKSGTITS